MLFVSISVLIILTLILFSYFVFGKFKFLYDSNIKLILHIIISIILCIVTHYYVYEIDRILIYTVLGLYSCVLLVYLLNKNYHNYKNSITVLNNNIKENKLQNKIILLGLFIINDIFCFSIIHVDIKSLSIIVMLLYLISYFLFYISIIVIPILLGNIIARLRLFKKDKKIYHSLQHPYFRELPNNYGIGINTILMDSVMENEKDLLAVILDLAAKRYINLKKDHNGYKIVLLKDIDDKLYQNEQYILSLIKEKELKNINYNDWYNLCIEDGVKEDLYIPKNIKRIFNLSMSPLEIFICILIWGIPSFIMFMSIDSILFMFIDLLIPIIIIIIFILSYKRNMRRNNLTRTKKGVKEYKKLLAFKSFIKDFGNFDERSIDEIVLWDYYLSYAQVFGLTKEIMQTGYNELVNNASFQIDNIDNITLDNIKY